MKTNVPPITEPRGNALQLTLATGAFVVCFAIFGSVSAMMPVLKTRLALSPVQVSVALAVPVLLGSLGRIPLGMLTDRYGGRLIFALVMLASIVPALLLGWVQAYWQLLVVDFFAGVSLASFAVGVGFVSRWFPPQRQGYALGVYGAGNIGQSLAAFGAPVIVTAFGFRWGFWTFALIALAWLAIYVALARNAPAPRVTKTFGQMIAPLRERKSWVLSLYYFLTFGGFVAMSVYLPTFLTDVFKLEIRDAGLRTAGFVVLATLMRPIGGVLADRVGGLTILRWVFPFTAVMALLMATIQMVPFTLGALGMAAAIGLGNGAVFKLVPEYFPQSVGSVTGLVGAAGGLGGFFPPLLLGIISEMFGSTMLGFVALALFALLCWWVAHVATPRRPGGSLKPAA